MENQNYDEIVYKRIWNWEAFYLVRVIKENGRYFIVKKVPLFTRVEILILPKILNFVEQFEIPNSE